MGRQKKDAAGACKSKAMKSYVEREQNFMSKSFSRSVEHAAVYEYKMPLTIKLYDSFEKLKVVGVVNELSKLHGQYKVGDDWSNIDDIEGIELEDVELC